MSGEPRIAEIPFGSAVYHVVRGERYACGSKRADQPRARANAHDVASVQRCQRIGCANDYAKADDEARP